MNVFDLAARIGLDTSDYNRGIEESRGTFSKFASGIKNGIGTLAKVTVAGIGAAAAGIGAITKQATESYANYEQLVGGIETMFEDLSYDVQENAQNAFRTAGLSANEYMETVMGFSAALNSSLKESEGNIARSAELSDQIIRDMSDNANKMGSSMESIQNAYSGFAKQNYTMLDNLKLGYGGTQAEMQRLIEDAEKIDSNFKAMRDETGTLKMSFTDVSEAIHIVQTELNITGTTAKEASSTISGSLSSMKSAWQNLLTGIADDSQDFDLLIDNFVDSASTFGGNIIPRIETAINGVGKLVEKLVPAILDELPSLLNDTLPTLINSALSVVDSVFDAVKNNMPAISKTLSQLISKLSEWLGNAPELIDLAVQLIAGIGTAILDNAPQLLEAAVGIVLQLTNYLIASLPAAIPQIVMLIAELAEMLTQPDTISTLIDAAVMLITALTDGLIHALPILLDSAPIVIENLVQAVMDNFPKLVHLAGDLIKTITNAILVNLPKIIESGGKIIDSLGTGIMSMLMTLNTAAEKINETIREKIHEAIDSAKMWGKDLIDNFIGGITAKWDALKGKLSETAQTIKDFLGFSEPKTGPLSNFHTYAPDMIDLFTKGMKESEYKLKSQLSDTADLIGGGFAETPQNKAGGLYSGGNIYNITVTAGTISSDYDARRAAKMMSEALAELQSIQNSALGA